MSDPVAELAAELAEMKRRLHALETAPRATKTSVSGGYTRWLPANGEDYPKVYAGALDDDKVGFFVDQDDGDDGSLIAADLFMGVADPTHITGDNELAPMFYVANPDHQLFTVVTVDGLMVAPLPACAWTMWEGNPVDTLGRRYTTSSSYTTMAAAVLPLHTAEIGTGVTVLPASGATSMDVRITIRAVGGAAAYGSGMELSPTAVTLGQELNVTTQTNFAGPFSVPDTLITPNGSPVGIQAQLLLQARVSGGAGQAVVSPYQPVFGRAFPP